jgi:hypothetical protein
VRIILTAIGLFSLSLLSACQHFHPKDTFIKEKIINIAIVNSESYMLVPNAHCSIITNTHDNVDTKLNPDAILLSITDYQSLALDCEADDYKQHAIAITNTINHWAASDLFVLPGNVIDLTGNLLPYYPSHVLVLMNKLPFATPNTTENHYKRAKADNILYQGTVA